MLRAVQGTCHTAMTFPRLASLVARARMEREKCDEKAAVGRSTCGIKHKRPNQSGLRHAATEITSVRSRSASKTGSITFGRPATASPGSERIPHCSALPVPLPRFLSPQFHYPSLTACQGGVCNHCVFGGERRAPGLPQMQAYQLPAGIRLI